MDTVYSTINFTQHALPFWASLIIYGVLYFLPTIIAVYRDARLKSKPFYNVEAARREITDADYEHLRSLVPQGEYVVLDADEEWECQ